MDFAVELTSLGLTFVFLAFVAAAYVVGAWYVARRMGPRALLATWVAAALLFAAYGTFQIHRRQAALGFRADQQHDAAFFVGTLGIAALCFGAATLTLRRRLRSGAPRLGIGGTLAGLAAWLGALIAVLLVVAMTDVAALLKTF